MARIFVYGGSTAYGFHDPERGGWAGRLKNTMTQRLIDDKRPAPDVLNNSICAWVLPRMLGRIKEDVIQHASGRTVGIFMVGASDSRICKNETSPIVPLPAFKDSLKRLGEICCGLEIRPLFVGPPPINDALTKPFPPTGEEFDDGRMQAYGEAVHDHAVSVEARYIDTWRALSGGMKTANDFLAHDGLHPNPLGHAIIHRLVLGTVDEILSLGRQAS